MDDATTEQDAGLTSLNDGASEVDDNRTANEKKTGRVLREDHGGYLDPLTVMANLKSPEAVRAYVRYLKDHQRRLKQLEKLARGELTPSVGSYG